MLVRLLLLCPLAALQACSVDVSSRNSDEVANPNVYAEFSALSSGTSGSVEISAVLLDAGASSTTYLRLNGGDQLLASNGIATDQALNLEGDLFGGTAEVSDAVTRLQERFRIDWDLLFIEATSDPSYFAIYANPDRSKPFYVSFLRTVDNSIHNAEIAFPPSFVITEPSAGGSLSRAEFIQVAWSPSGSNYEMRLQTAATCGNGSERYYGVDKVITGDPGVAQVTAADIFGTATPSGTCAVALALKRIRYGTVPAMFGGGGVAMGTEKRVVNFQSK